MHFHHHHLRNLEDRIRSMIRSLHQSQQKINQIPTFTFLFDSSQFILFRCAWLLIVLACSSLFCYQCSKRFMLYRARPVVVDVDMAEASEIVFPALSICAEMTDETSKLFKQYPAKTIDSCDEAFIPLTRGIFPGYDVETLWKMADIAKAANASILEKKKLVDVPERENSEVSPFGMCGTFKSAKTFSYRGIDQKFVVQIRNQDKGCGSPLIHGSTHGVNDPFSIRNMWGIGCGSENIFSYRVTQYKFLSRSKKKCTSRKRFSKCIAVCKKKIYEKLTCKFPFFPSDVDLPWCKPSNETAKLFLDGKSMYLRFNHKRYCQCHRPCEITQREEVRVLLNSYSDTNSTIISMYYSTNLVQIMAERYSYDFISLLCDVGGNSGLYLGLSLLSVFEFLNSFWKWVMSSVRKTKHSNSDPLFKKVRRVYYNYITSLNSKSQNQNKKVQPNVVQLYQHHNKQARSWDARRVPPHTRINGNVGFIGRDVKCQTRRGLINYPNGNKYRDLDFRAKEVRVAVDKRLVAYPKELQQWNGGRRTQRMEQNYQNYGRTTQMATQTQELRVQGFGRVFKVLRNISIVFGFLLCIWLIYDRIMHYLSKPIYLTVDVLENDTLWLPSLMVCFPSTPVTEKRKMKAAQSGKSDHCELDFLELIDENFDSLHLWNLSDNAKEFWPLPKRIEMSQPKHIRTSFSLPLGNCQRFDVEPLKYAGWSTHFCILAGYRGVCDEKYYTLYFTPAGEEVDYTSYIHVPIDASVEVSFTIKKEIYNPEITHCVDPAQAAACKRNCLWQKLSNIKCRLPYMDYLNKTSFCSTASEAKQAHAAYLEAFLTTDLIKECGCPKGCDVTIYDSRVFIISEGIPVFFTVFTFRHPYIEVFHEMRAYHWEKLFCDIGAIVGLMLGISLYSLSDLVQNAGVRVSHSQDQRKIKSLPRHLDFNRHM